MEFRVLLDWLAVGVVVVLGIVVIVRALRRAAAQPTGMKLVDQELPHQPLETRALPAASRDRYSQTWAEVQPRFADDPEVALRETDRLVQNLMRECGYPTGDFGRVSEIVTTEQIDVLENYRAAHRITVKGETTMLEPPEIERAVGAFRAVFDALIAMDGIGT